MEYAPRKIAVPKDGKQEAPMEITRAYLDSNNHVNNARYVQSAEGYLPEGFTIQQLRAEYKRQAFLGDRMHPVVAQTDDEWIISLNNENGQPYAVIAFKLGSTEPLSKKPPLQAEWVSGGSMSQVEQECYH